VFPRFRVNSGGVQTANYVSSRLSFDGVAEGTGAATDHILISDGTGDVPNTGEGVNGYIESFGPLDGTAICKMWNGVVSFRSTTKQNVVVVSGQWNGGTGAVTGFEVTMNSGNITSGTVRVLGLR
jgi:hypothetical protein